MTRILHLGTLYPPHIMGGAERSVSILAEAMADAGHDVAASCISPTGWSHESRNGVKVYRMPHETDFWPEEWPDHTTLERGRRRFKQQFNYRLERHFLEVIDDFRPDIINTHSLLDVSTRVWVAAKKRDIPIVHTLRDYDLLCGNAALFKDGKRCERRHMKCLLFTFMKRLHQRNVAGVVGVGREILQTHIDFGCFGQVPTDLRRVIWNPAVVEGIDASYIKPPLTDQPFTFGYLGRINIEKGVGTLLDACKLLPPGSWKLLIAGKEASEERSLKPMAVGLPVEFIGFVPPRAFFDKIDALVVPSIWAEPLPRTILEAYAAGVPALGANSGGIPDLIGSENTEWLFPPGDAVTLAARMQRMIDQGRGALPGKQEFEHIVLETQPAKVADRYLDFYRAVTQADQARQA